MFIHNRHENLGSWDLQRDESRKKSQITKKRRKFYNYIKKEEKARELAYIFTMKIEINKVSLHTKYGSFHCA